MKILKKKTFVLSATLMLALGIQAQTAITTTGPYNQSGIFGESTIYGWGFVPTVDLTVNKLGLFDGHFEGDGHLQDGFVDPHNVTLWDLDGNIISTVLFEAGASAPLDGRFRYLNIDPVNLNAGHTYIIGAFMPLSSDFISFFGSRQSFSRFGSFDPHIRFVSARIGVSSDPTAFPEIQFEPGLIGAFGPNFIFDVPEPSVFGICMIGLAGFITKRKRALS